MKTLKLNKTAGMTQKQIIEIIILILCFLILLFLYFRFEWNPRIDKESCHNSIILRSTLNSATKGLEVGSKVIPLKCKTEKICLTMSGENCEAFGIPSKDNPITKVKLSKDIEKAREKIKETIANSLYDCNSMLGEGKLDFLPHKFWNRNYGLICSRFAFDTQTQEEINGLGYGELYLYLQKKQIPNKGNYLEYIYPGIENWEVSKIIFEDLKDRSNDSAFKELDFTDWKIYTGTENGYAIIGQMTSIGTWGKALKIGGVVVGGIITIIGLAAIPAGGIGTVAVTAGITIIKGAMVVGSSAIFVYDHPNDKYHWIPPMIYSYDKETLMSLGCSSFETAP